MRAIAYVRVSSEEQAQSGAGLAAQSKAVFAEIERRGWQFTAAFEDAAFSAKDLNRPGIQAALDLLDHGAADALVVAKLDRLSRSMLDFAMLMSRAQKGGWGIVALDLNVDTTTPSGEVMANVMAAFAQFERRLIGQRTREALERKRATGTRLGRPPAIAQATEIMIREYRKSGLTLAAIAARLEAEGHVTVKGGPWRPSTLSRVLGRAA